MSAVFESYWMSIETSEGNSFVYGYMLGSDEKIARFAIEERFHSRREMHLPTVTIALLNGNKNIVDVYYGDKWQSQIDDDLFNDEREEQLSFSGL